MKKFNHDTRVAIWGIVGALGLFGFSIFLAMLGPYIEAKANKEKEEQPMYIDESTLDDIREEMEEHAIEVNGQQYILVDSAVDILQEYLDDEED